MLGLSKYKLSEPCSMKLQIYNKKIIQKYILKKNIYTHYCSIKKFKHLQITLAGKQCDDGRPAAQR